MSDSLIEQVKRLAEAQKAIPEGAQLEGTMYGTVDAAYVVQQASAFDFPALLAHMQAQQAVVDAARKLREGMNVGVLDVYSYRHLAVQQWRWDAFKDALTALENLENTDGK